jgi:hypothetical protein
MMNIVKTADLCFDSFSLLQDRVFYHKGENTIRNCHYEDIKRSLKHQSESHHMEKQTHLMEIYAEMEQHFQQLNADLLSSTKENGNFEFNDIIDLFNHELTLLIIFHIPSTFITYRT